MSKPHSPSQSATMSDRKHQTTRDSSSASLLVIGAGLMRTGTNSQMKALEILLGGRCYHMEYILTERRDHLKLWYRAAVDGLTKARADEIFKGCRASTDFPAAHFYQELMEIYPNAKFVLSVRDPKRWVQSVRATVYRARSSGNMVLQPVLWLMGLNYMDLLQGAMEPRMGLSPSMTDEQLIEGFERHNQAVIDTIPKERLLIFRVTDGWEPLCKFLDLPVPDVPFPNVNDTEQFQRRVRNMKIVGMVLNIVFGFAVGAAVWFGAKLGLQMLA